MERDNKSTGSFIRETIREAPEKKPSVGRRFLCLAAYAVSFGVIASAAATVTRPWMETHLMPHVSDAAAATENETEEPSQPEKVILDVPEDVMRQKVDEKLDEYMETLNLEELADSISCQTLLQNAMAQLKPSMVQVTTYQVNEDVFHNEITRSTQSFGIILSKTREEILILTESNLLQKARKVQIRLNNQERADGILVARDDILGMAVVSVDSTQISRETRNGLVPAELGMDYQLKAGDLVFAMGNPTGMPESVAQGVVSYINNAQQTVDMNLQLIQTDMACDTEASGILTDREGNIIGWVTQQYNTDENRHLLSAMSINDLRDHLEDLCQGKKIPCLGIYMQPVTRSMAEEYGLPEGLYISRCQKGNAAYEAGLQSGDILTKIDGEVVSSGLELKAILEKHEPEDLVEVTIMRKGRDGYTEQNYQVILTER